MLIAVVVVSFSKKEVLVGCDFQDTFPEVTLITLVIM